MLQIYVEKSDTPNLLTIIKNKSKPSMVNISVTKKKVTKRVTVSNHGGY